MVHSFINNGYRIAMDSASGAVHVLSETAYNLLATLTPPLAPELAAYKNDEEREAYKELYSLYEAGELFSEDVEIDSRLVGAKVIKSLCLHISHDCNMRCRYCFAGTGDFHRGRMLMTEETGRRAIDFLLSRSGSIRNLELDFFGGEPLLNFDVVKALVKYGREAEKPYGKNIRFTITTNGSLLDDDSIAFINENMSNAVLSVDGRKSVNDRNRTFEDGSGTYDSFIGRYKQLVAGRGDKDWYVRGTYTRENLDFTNDVLSLANEGFDEISVEPVVLDHDDPMSLREEELPAIFDEYDRLSAEMVRRYREDGKCFNFYHFMIDLDAGPCVYKRVKGCGSGSEYIAITPDGDIYPCHQFVGYPEYKMGNINEGTFDTEVQKRFSGCNILTMESCKSCWAKYFCGGGCAANNYKFNHDPAKAYKLGCELEKKRVECAMMIKAALSDLEDEQQN